jgi:glutamyl/glutaminyl-tRNA synthetase
MLFVNDASYGDHLDTLLENKRLRKKVFISYDEEPVKGFDHTVKKPFLPSQIIELIESVDMSEVIEEQEEEDISLSTVSTEEEGEEEALPPIFSLPTEKEEALNDTSELSDGAGTEVLDGNEIEKIKALLEMDDETVLDEEEPISDDEYEARKVKIIKEKLIADGLEIIEEDEIVEELSAVVVTLSEEADKKKTKKNKKKKKKETRFSKEELSRIEDALIVALDKMKPKKLKKLLKGKKIEIKIKLEDER